MLRGNWTSQDDDPPDSLCNSGSGSLVLIPEDKPRIGAGLRFALLLSFSSMSSSPNMLLVEDVEPSCSLKGKSEVCVMTENCTVPPVLTANCV